MTGTSTRLERLFSLHFFKSIVSAGYPPADYPLNRGDWFSTYDYVENPETGVRYVRTQELYTGTMCDSKPAMWERVPAMFLEDEAND